MRCVYQQLWRCRGVRGGTRWPNGGVPRHLVKAKAPGLGVAAKRWSLAKESGQMTSPTVLVILVGRLLGPY